MNVHSKTTKMLQVGTVRPPFELSEFWQVEIIYSEKLRRAINLCRTGGSREIRNRQPGLPVVRGEIVNISPVNQSI